MPRRCAICRPCAFISVLMAPSRRPHRLESTIFSDRIFNPAEMGMSVADLDQTPPRVRAQRVVHFQGTHAVVKVSIDSGAAISKRNTSCSVAVRCGNPYRIKISGGRKKGRPAPGSGRSKSKSFRRKKRSATSLIICFHRTDSCFFPVPRRWSRFPIEFTKMRKECREKPQAKRREEIPIFRSPVIGRSARLPFAPIVQRIERRFPKP